MKTDFIQMAFRPDTLLGRLSPSAREALAAIWRVEQHSAGSMIIGDKDTGRDVFFILKGSVRAAAFTMNGREVSFNVIQEGDCFGEIAAIDGGVRSSGVSALEDVVNARVSPADFLNLLDSNSELSRIFLYLMCGKVRSMSDRLLAYTELTTPQRVRQELVRLAREARALARNKGDSALITMFPTQEEIGKQILARREAVAREMARLKRRGLIEKRKEGYYVPSLRKLEAEVLL